MRILTTSLLVAFMVQSGCSSSGSSRLNPFNWFGGGSSGEVVADAVPADQEQSLDAEPNPLIPAERRGLFRNVFRSANEYQGTPIDQVSNLVIERAPGGAIVRATGITAVQGVHKLQLTPSNIDEVPDENGVLTYRFEGVWPNRPVRGGPERVRTVMAARFVTDKQLSEARVIRVEARRNAQQTTRR